MTENEIRMILIECTDLLSKPGAYPFLPSIIECLEKMYEIIRNGQWDSRNTRTGAALGRLVLEDFSFFGSELGKRLLKIADVWSKKY